MTGGRSRWLGMGALMVVMVVMLMQVGCHGPLPALPVLLAAESLPGGSPLSGPVDPKLGAVDEREQVAAIALASDEARAEGGGGAGSRGHGAGELRVMSVNVRFHNFLDLHNNWRHRRDLFIATVRRFEPDVLGTQESLWSQTQDIRAALPEYGYFGAGRIDGETSGEMCGVFYREDRYRKLDGGHFWLSRRPDQPGSRAWLEPFPRIVTWVKLEPRDAAGKPFYFFNTHFAAFSRWARENSAELMRERIAAITHGAPVIVAGDFNAYGDSRTYRVMRDGLSPEARTFKDTYRKAHPQVGEHENTIHRFRGSTRGRRIDWILACEAFDTVASAIDRTNYHGRYPSDHFPVQAVLRWKRADDAHEERADDGALAVDADDGSDDKAAAEEES